jgi:hypothetical protein
MNRVSPFLIQGMRPDELWQATRGVPEVPALNAASRGSTPEPATRVHVTIGVLTTGPRLQNACNDTFLQPNYYTYSNSDHVEYLM